MLLLLDGRINSADAAVISSNCKKSCGTRQDAPRRLYFIDAPSRRFTVSRAHLGSCSGGVWLVTLLAARVNPASYVWNARTRVPSRYVDRSTFF